MDERLDVEPTTGLHPPDVEKRVAQLHGLVDAGHTGVVVEHDMHVIDGSDCVIGIGPGAGGRRPRRRRRLARHRGPHPEEPHRARA